MKRWELLPDQMLVPRKRGGPLDGAWKVTARYTFHLDGERTVQGARVSMYGRSGSFTLHLSLDEVQRLFRPERPDEAKARRERVMHGSR